MWRPLVGDRDAIASPSPHDATAALNPQAQQRGKGEKHYAAQDHDREEGLFEKVEVLTYSNRLRVR